MTTKISKIAAGFTAAALAFVTAVSSVQEAGVFGGGSKAYAAGGVIELKRPSGQGTADQPFLIGTTGEMWWYAGWVNGTLPLSEVSSDETSQDTSMGDPASSDGPSLEESDSGNSKPEESTVGDSTSVVTETESAAPAAKPMSVDAPTAVSAAETCGKHLDACAKLTASIDLQASDDNKWVPIGNGSIASDSNTFVGTFDGDGFTISGLNTTKNSGRNPYGLFVFSKGTIQNLTVKGSISSGWFIGLVVADNVNGGKVINCHADGTVGSNYSGGGLVGYNDGLVDKCSAKAKIVSGTGLGVLTGNNGANGVISDCIAIGGITTSGEEGGITSYNSNIIKNCVYIDDGTGIANGRGAIASTSKTDGGVTNCYYYSEKVKGGIGGNDVVGQAEFKDKTSFTDGEITWRLQNAREDDTLVWTQKIGEEEYPQLAGKNAPEDNRVYRLAFMYPTIDEEYAARYANKGQKPAAVDDPVSDESGYSFDGWYEDSGFAKKADTPVPDSLTEDVVRYGKGEKVKFTISYDLHGGSYPSGINPNPTEYYVDSEDITLVPPTLKGHEFSGWSGDGLNTFTTHVVIPKGSVGNRKYMAHFMDKEPPTGSITISNGDDTYNWNTFTDKVDFSVILMDSGTARINAGDTGTDEQDLKIEYFVDSQVRSRSELESVNWSQYNKDAGIVLNTGRHIIYVRITDLGGSSTYINSQGIIVDNAPPVISGVESNLKYCEAQNIIVTDNNLSYVAVNGRKIKVNDDGTFTLSYNTGTSSNAKTIVAVDVAGKFSKVTVYVYNGHIPGIEFVKERQKNTCTEDGLVVYAQNCQNCGIELNTRSVVLPATKHWFTSWKQFVSEGCPGDGGEQRNCVLCGYTETRNVENDGHDWEDAPRIDKAPTCTDDGSKSVHCADCQATRDSEVIPPLGHTAAEPTETNIIPATCTTGGSYDLVTVCETCGEQIDSQHILTDPLGHTPGDAVMENVVEASCDATGIHDLVVYCETCHIVLSKDEGIIDEAKGHSFDEWHAIDTEGTCDPTGEIHTCQVCGYSETRNMTEDSHAWDADYTIDKEPTCTEEGSRSIHCSKCGATKNSETILSTGHVSGKAEKMNEQKATCLKEGCYDEVVFCTVCGEEVSRITISTGLAEHEVTEEVTETPASCDKPGSRTTVTRCTVCDTHISEVTTEIPATGHKFGEWYVTDSSTCEGEGGQARVCEVCGYTETKGLTAAGHVWDTDYTVDKEPTCTEEGSRSYHCEVCDARGASEPIPPLGHTGAEAVKENETPADCTNDGHYDEVVYCSVCGEKISSTHKDTPATGHVFGEWEQYTSEFCTGDGGERRACTVCGFTETRNVEDNGHDWLPVPVVDKEPTCTDAGSQSYHCADCGATTESEVIPALGHTPKDAVKENIKDSDCTAEGSYDEVVYCDTCGTELSRNTFTISIKDHVPGKPAVENLVEAGCETDGSYEEVVRCTVCGIRLSLKTVEVPATGHDISDKWSSDKDAHWHACNNCGEKFDVAEHTPSDWIVEKEATPHTDGSRYKACTVCGYVIETEILPAYAGNVYADTVCGEGAPSVSISDEIAQQLEDELISDEDREFIDNGGDIDIVLQVENADESVSSEDMAAVEGCLENTDYEIGHYLDIEMFKMFIQNGANDSVQIKELKNPISLRIQIPDDLKADNRTFAIVRIHDGLATLLEDTDTSPDTVTISTDKFSTYAIVYSDKVPTQPTDPTEDPTDTPTDDPADTPTDDPADTPTDNPDTGIPASGAAAVSALAAVVAAVAVRKKKN